MNLQDGCIIKSKTEDHTTKKVYAFLPFLGSYANMP